MGNKFLFYPPENSINESLLSFIIKVSNYEEKPDIPCLFLPYESDYFTLIFHGNAEDIFTYKYYATILRDKLKSNIVVVEYPGYSLYDASKSAETIKSDALRVYDFLNQIIEIPSNNIMVIGRSLGSGPAIYLATEKKIKKLVLISPFTSISDVAGNLSFLIENSFKNIELFPKVTAKTLLIHGRKDTVLKCSYSEELKNVFTNESNIKFKETENDHNNFCYNEIANLVIDYFGKSDDKLIEFKYSNYHKQINQIARKDIDYKNQSKV